MERMGPKVINTGLLSGLSGLFISLLVVSTACSGSRTLPPKELSSFLDTIEIEPLASLTPEIEYTKIAENTYRISISAELSDSLYQDDWRVNIKPAFMPEFHWAPHLTPAEGYIIAQHVFRAPALIITSEQKTLTVIPDLDLLNEQSPVDWYMDMDAANNVLALGLSESKIEEHVLYLRDEGAVYPPGRFSFGFYVICSSEKEDIMDPWRNALAFLWERWGQKEFHDYVTRLENVDEYVQYTYKWAFESWREAVWQEFELNGKQVGAPSFIVNVTQSPNYPGEYNLREFLSIWNQAWFSSLRSASGLYRYARRVNDPELMEYANKTKELALQFPQREGFFPGIIGVESIWEEIGGETYLRPRSWDQYKFGNSNRNPYTWNPWESPYHILDMSVTAKHMLDWHKELEADRRLIDYSTRYADALVGIQSEEGFFPAWLDTELKPLEPLDRSPETSMSVTFLLKLYEISGDKKYLNSALKAMDAVVEEIVFSGRWEDYETYWSCCRFGSEDMPGKKFERNNQYKQNTLSIYWTAEALLTTYQITGNEEYLLTGTRVLDELLMYQAAWQAPFIYIRAIGGFGVMNCDGEWNDSRQSLFAELIIKYGEVLGRDEYLERGLAALYASFEMMYCPKNPETKKQWEQKWPFFNEKDYGFMMENYGHGGETSREGLGIGSFTIYDWGNGAAAEAYNRIVDHYGREFVENPRK